MVMFLDDNLRAYTDVVRRSVGIDVSGLEGGGAAGGMGAGAFAFFGAELKPGIDVVLDFIHFEELLEHCDYVLTGEGRLDRQSLGGKVAIGVGRRAKEMNVPVLAVVGSAEEGLDEISGQGISGVFPAVREEISLEDLKLRCRTDLSNVMNQVIAAIKQDEESGI
jgi:glycerate kinase